MNQPQKSNIEKATVILAFLPLLVTLALLPAMPKTIPAHYGTSGAVNRWGSKYESLILPAFAMLWAFFPRIVQSISAQNNGSNKTSNQRIINLLFLCPVLVFNVLCYIFLALDFSKRTNLSGIGLTRILVWVLAAADIVIGNYLPKCSRNESFGIRLKWTLENENVWNKTHRFGGKLIVLTGLLVIAVCAFLPNSFNCLIPYFVSVMIDLSLIVIYSRHASEKQRKPGDET